MLTTLTLTVVLAYGEGKPAQAPRPPQAPATQAKFVYREAAALAVKNGQPLVVFINTPTRNIEGAQVTAVEALDGYFGPCIVVSRPARGWLDWSATLDANATMAEIRLATFGRQGVGNTPRPFQPFKAVRSFAQRIADVNLKDRGLWSPTVVNSKEYTRYRSARYTQRIYRSNGANSATVFFDPRSDGAGIDRVDRDAIEAKWNSPGGLEGIDGWRSDLYYYFPKEPERLMKHLPVFNGSNDQYEWGYVAKFLDGTEFHDVLSYNGKVFEHRIAEKVGGRWNRFVAYKDVSARPPGYYGLTQTCASCHDQTSSGNYGAGLVPGSDTIISFAPNPALE